MKILDAHWEKRNIGVSCHEVIIEPSDTIKDLTKLDSLQSDYQVIKLPVQKYDLNVFVQQHGFRFIELNFVCIHDLLVPQLSKPLERMATCFKVLEADEGHLSTINGCIASEMFLTDRVAIDPKFGPKLAARRYLGWLEDLLKSGAKVFVMKYKVDTVGFFVMRCSDTICDAVLGGIFPSMASGGFGVMLNYLEIITAANLGCKELHGRFSSNNAAIFAINRTLGYKIRPEHYVFIKHSQERPHA
jgi:hypothetical protein